MPATDMPQFADVARRTRSAPRGAQGIEPMRPSALALPCKDHMHCDHRALDACREVGRKMEEELHFLESDPDRVCHVAWTSQATSEDKLVCRHSLSMLSCD